MADRVYSKADNVDQTKEAASLRYSCLFRMMNLPVIHVNVG